MKIKEIAYCGQLRAEIWITFHSHSIIIRSLAADYSYTRYNIKNVTPTPKGGGAVKCNSPPQTPKGGRGL